MEAERRCLKCGKMFLSMWKGNRICQKCKGSSANTMAPSMPAGAREKLVKKVRKHGHRDSWRENPMLPEKAK